MSGSETPGAVAPDIGYGVLGVDPSLVQNVRARGAIGDGEIDDTVAIQEALDAVDDVFGGVVDIPPGTYLFSAPLLVKSSTRVTGAGTLKSVPLAQRSGTPYYGLTNVNNTATTYTDHDITIEGITIDYTDLPSADGTRHCIYIQAAERVTVQNVTVLGGSSAVALVGCDDTLEFGNRLIGFSNCGSDHWAGFSLNGPSNGRLIGCHIETTSAAQMVNWNAIPTTGAQVGFVADTFVMMGNTLVSTENPSTPCQIEPLSSSNPSAAVRSVVVQGNTFKGCYLVMRGEVIGASINGNIFSDFQGTGEAITIYDRNNGSPSNIEVIGNTVLDPFTSAGNLGVIRVESDTATIAFNRIKGSGYACVPIYVGSTAAQMFGNTSDGTQTAGYLKTGFRFPPGSSTSNYIGWVDNAGSTPRMYCQSSDNNFIFHGTGSTGAQRTIWSVVQRSNTSEFNISVPTRVNSTFSLAVTASLAATGNGIGSAANLSASCTLVTSATAGVNDGVILSPTNGRTQEIVNGTAVTINVYPNNSGSSQIDAGGVGVPATIAAGKSKTFRQFATGDFRTVAAT